ncbi:MAG: T9SS type A sorting domain-containing protein, partial [Candidatus Kapaibacterium sp.]
VLTDYTSELPDIKSPNTLYENPCIKKYELAPSIAQMKLERPNLGSYQGTLNLPVKSEYTIRGVAGFYGGVMNNIFPTNKKEIPSLFMFHQPNDLIVPIKFGTVFDGYNKCTRDILGCQNIVNLKTVWGSVGITDILDTMEIMEQKIPEYKLETSNNNANCIEQTTDPSRGGHQYDNYWQRTSSAATFLANYIVDCEVETGVNEGINLQKSIIFPNPLVDRKLIINNVFGKIELSNTYGQTLIQIVNTNINMSINLNEYNLTAGVYYITISNE